MLSSYWNNRGACSPPTQVIGEHALLWSRRGDAILLSSRVDPLLLHGVGGEHAPSYSMELEESMLPYGIGGEILYYGVGGEHAPLLLHGVGGDMFYYPLLGEILYYGVGGKHAPLLLQ